MTGADLLVDAFARIHGAVHRAVHGLTPDQLAIRLDDEANSIAWLVWHLTRIQDDHVAGVAAMEQAWTSLGWAERFGLPFDDAATGYGQRSEDVAAVTVSSASVLTGYFDAVHERTVQYVEALNDDDLDRIVDASWDPPVSLGVRLVSVVADSLEHVGQAAFVRGVLDRRPAGDGRR